MVICILAGNQTTKRGSAGRGTHGWITILKKVTKKFPFEPRPGEVYGISHMPMWGRDFQADGRASPGP